MDPNVSFTSCSPYSFPRWLSPYAKFLWGIFGIECIIAIFWLRFFWVNQEWIYFISYYTRNKSVMYYSWTFKLVMLIIRVSIFKERLQILQLKMQIYHIRIHIINAYFNCVIYCNSIFVSRFYNTWVSDLITFLELGTVPLIKTRI